MTIAAGFRCNEGIVLCADMQETITGYIKGYDGKIVTHLFPHAIVCITGSGTSDYIHAAREKALIGLDEVKDYESIRRRLESNLINFFDEHLARWSAFGESERPTVELTRFTYVFFPRAGSCAYHL